MCSREYHFSGIGIHTGLPCELTICALHTKGISFQTPEGAVSVNLNELNLEHGLCTRICAKTICIQTIEHLMAALCYLGSGALVKMNANEVPIMDGSALPFMNAIKKPVPPAPIEIKHPIACHIGQSRASIIPPANEYPVYTVQLDYAAQAIGPLSYSFRPFVDDIMNIAPARTFALRHEAEHMQRQGLALGGTMENALILDGNQVLTPGGKRFDDEPARHKMLDLIGDLFLLGGLPYADIIVEKPGHRCNHQLARKIFNQTR